MRVSYLVTSVRWDVAFGRVWVRFVAGRGWTAGGRPTVATLGRNWGGRCGRVLARGRINEVRTAVAIGGLRDRRVGYVGFIAGRDLPIGTRVLDRVVIRGGRALSGGWDDREGVDRN